MFCHRNHLHFVFPSEASLINTGTKMDFTIVKNYCFKTFPPLSLLNRDRLTTATSGLQNGCPYHNLFQSERHVQQTMGKPGYQNGWVAAHVKSPPDCHDLRHLCIHRQGLGAELHERPKTHEYRRLSPRLQFPPDFAQHIYFRRGKERKNE